MLCPDEETARAGGAEKISRSYDDSSALPP